MSSFEEHEREQAAITASFDIEEMIPAPIDHGEDPEDMNEMRAVWGMALARTCHQMTGTDMDTAISDSISYLLHAAKTMGSTAEQEVRHAIRHFNEETGGPQ